MKYKAAESYKKKAVSILVLSRKEESQITECENYYPMARLSLFKYE
jgi:hypothetical protein